MAYGKIKAEALIYNNTGNDVELVISDIVTSSGSLSAYALLAGATFTGDVNFDGGAIIKGDATNGSGELTLNCENNSHGIKIKGPPHSAAATYTLTLPNNTGTNGQVLTTNGSGVSSWSTIDLASKLSLTGGTLTGGLTGTTANFSGNVGVGTSSPTVSYGNGLHIAGGNAGLKLQNTNNGDWAYIEYADESNTTKFIQGYRDQSGVYGIRPGTSLNATPGLSLDSSGRVGIGVTPPNLSLIHI